MYVKRFLASLNFPIQIPPGFLKVLHTGLEICSPDVLDRVAQVKAHMLGVLDALNTGWVLSVMLWMVYRVVVHERVSGEYSPHQ
jgi:hypothetical protein